MSGVEGSSLPPPRHAPPPPPSGAMLHRRPAPPAPAAPRPHHLFRPPPFRHYHLPPRPHLPPPPPAPPAASAAAAAPPPPPPPPPKAAAVAKSAPPRASPDRKPQASQPKTETGNVQAEVSRGGAERGHEKASTTGSGTGLKRPRKTKGSRHTADTSDCHGTNEGAGGISLFSSSNCRYDSSLGLLTKKFINLLQGAEDGTLDLNKAAEILEVQKRRIYDITNVLEGVDLIEKKLKNMIRWKGFDMSRPKELDQQVSTLKEEVESLYKEDCRLDETIREMQDKLHAITTDENKRKWLYLTKEDINNIPCFRQGSTLIAINAPHGTSIEVPNPEEGFDISEKHYQILLRSSMGPIACYLISNHEQRSTGGQLAVPVDSSPEANNNVTALHPLDQCPSRSSEKEDNSAACEHSSESPTVHEFMAGVLRIVPPDADIDADYWLSSDMDVSITDTWRT